MSFICNLCKGTKDESDIITCVLCNKSFHAVKCTGLTRTTLKTVTENPNLKWFCNLCIGSSFTTMNILSARLDESRENFDKKLDEISDADVKKQIAILN